MYTQNKDQKGFAEIAGDEGAVIEFGLGDLFSVQFNALKFFGEYVHVVGNGGHANTIQVFFSKICVASPFKLT